MTQPSLEIPLYRCAEEDRFDELRKAARDAEEVLTAQGARAANQHLLDTIGVSIGTGLNESYCNEMLNYNLALLHATLGNHEQAAQHMHASGALPAVGGNLVFSDQVRISLEIHERQQQAFERGMPAIILSSMPRAASAFLSQTIAKLLDIPIMRVSTGAFADYGIIPRWLNCFTPGGGVLHDHFGASDYNLSVLRDCGVREVFVLVRDPRAAALSYTEHVGGYSEEQLGHTVHRVVASRFVPWLRSWAIAEDAQKDWLRIHWIFSSAVRADVGSAILSIVARLKPLYPALACAEEGIVPTIRANMMHGDDNRWRSVVPHHFHPLLWNELGDVLAERFGFLKDAATPPDAAR